MLGIIGIQSEGLAYTYIPLHDVALGPLSDTYIPLSDAHTTYHIHRTPHTDDKREGMDILIQQSKMWVSVKKCSFLSALRV